MKMTKKKSLAKASTRSMKPVKPTGELLEQLNRQKATIRIGAFNSLKIEGSTFFVNENSLGNEVYAVILENVFEHRYFTDAYDEDVVKAPDCFALGLSEPEMVPSPNSESIQAETCGQCEWNRFGSGRGKAKRCQNRIRLMLLPKDNANPKDIDDAETFMLFVPPTSIRAFNKYADMCINKLEVPTSLIVTCITAEQERGKTYSELQFDYESPLAASPAFQKQLVAKVQTARSSMLAPYERSVDEDEAPKKGKGKRKASVKRKSRLG